MAVVPDISSSKGEQSSSSLTVPGTATKAPEPVSTPEPQPLRIHTEPAVEMPSATPEPLPAFDPSIPSPDALKIYHDAYKDVTPDAAFNYESIANSFQAPFDLVKSNPKEFEAQKKVNDIFATITGRDAENNLSTPATVDFLSGDALNLAKHKDDPMSLVKFENVAKARAQIPQTEKYDPIASGDVIMIDDPLGRKQAIEQAQAGRFASYVGTFASGATRGVTALPKFVNSITHAISPLEWGTTLQESPMYAALTELEKSVEQGLPQNPEFKNEFAGQVFNALGQVTAMVGGGGITKIAAQAPKAFSIINGVAQEFIATFEEAKEHGATEADAYKAAITVGALAGPLEAVFPEHLISHLFVNKTTSTLGQKLVHMALGVTEEALTEPAQSLIENATAKAIYDKDRNYWDGVAQASGVGGVSAFVAESLIMLATGTAPKVQRVKQKVSPDIVQGLQDHMDEVKTLEIKEQAHQANVQSLNDLKTIADESEVAKKSPDEVVKVLDGFQAHHNAAPTTDVNAKAISEVFFQGAKTPEEAAQAQSDLLKFAETVGGMSPKQLDEAVQSGFIDMKVKTSELVALYRDHPIFKGIQKIGDEDIAQNKKDLIDIQNRLTKSMAEDVVPAQLEPIRQMLMKHKDEGGGGMSQIEADTNLNLTVKMLGRFAAESGQTLEEKLKEINLEIQAGETPTAFVSRVQPKEGEVRNQPAAVGTSRAAVAHENSFRRVAAENIREGRPTMLKKQDIALAKEDPNLTVLEYEDGSGEIIAVRNPVTGERESQIRFQSQQQESVDKTQLAKILDNLVLDDVSFEHEIGIKVQKLTAKQIQRLAEDTSWGDSAGFRKSIISAPNAEEGLVREVSGAAAINPQWIKADLARQAVYQFEQAKALGYKSISEWMGSDGEKSFNAVINSGKTWRENNPRPDPSKAGDVLLQGGESPRAAIQFLSSKTIVHLFSNADKTSFAHELFHLGMKQMQGLVESGLASEQTIKDWHSMLHFVKSNDGKLNEAQEEKLATQWEAYLMAGKAPSFDLVDTFRRLKSWFLDVYKNMRGTIEISPELVPIFDRMLAAEGEISEANSFYENKASVASLIEALPESPAKEELKREAQSVVDEQIETATKKHLGAYLKTNKAGATIKTEVSSQVDSEKFYQVVKVLTKEKLNTEAFIQSYGQEAFDSLNVKFPQIFSDKGTAVLEDTAIDNGYTSLELQEDLKTKLPRNAEIQVRVDKRVSQIEAELRHDISNDLKPGDAETHSEKSLAYMASEVQLMLNEAAKQNALRQSRIVAKVYTDTAKEGLAQSKFKDAVRYDKYSKAAKKAARQQISLVTKVGKLNQKLGGQEVVSSQAQEDAAVKTGAIADKALSAQMSGEEAQISGKEVSAAGQAVRFSQDVTNQKQSITKNINELWAKAIEFGKQRLLNHAYIQESIKLREKFAKDLNKFSGKKIKSALENMEFAYQEPYIEVLSRYGLTNKANPTEYDLAQLKDVNEDLFNLMPTWIRDKQNIGRYQELTVDQFNQLVEFAGNIQSMGRDTLFAMEEGKEVKWAEDREKKVLNIEALNDKKFAQDRDWFFKTRKAAASLIDSNYFPVFIFKILDLHKPKKQSVGANEEVFVKMVNSNTELTSRVRKWWGSHQDPFNMIQKVVKRVSKQKGFKFSIEGVPMPERAQLYGDSSWTVEKAFMVLLNLGNAQNEVLVREGMGLKQEQIDAVSKLFTAQELQQVQVIWDAINELYPDLNKEYFDITNSKMKKVEGKPVSLMAADGTLVNLNGGYFPIAYDKRYDTRQQALEEENIMRKNAVYRSHKPEDGMTVERGRTLQLPPKLSMNVISQHVSDTLRYITHAKTLIDTARMLKDKVWIDAVERKMGVGVVGNLRDWALYNANPEQTTMQDGASNIVKFLEFNRKLSIYKMLGFKPTSAVVQKLGLITAGQQVGWGYMAKAAMQLGYNGNMTQFGFMSKAYEEMRKESKIVEGREDAVDFNQAEIMKGWKPIRRFGVTVGGVTLTGDDVKSWAFNMMKWSDRGVVLQTYTAAKIRYAEEFYDDTLSAKENDKKAVEYAEQMIIKTQPTGLSADTNWIQRSRNPIIRSFIMVQSWAFKAGSMQTAEYRAFKEGAITPMQYMNFLGQNIILVGIAEELLRSIIRLEPPEWADVAMNWLQPIIGWVPFLKDAIYPVVKKGDVGGAFGNQQAFLAAKEVAKAPTAIKRAIQGKIETSDAVIQTAKSIGVVTGIPVGNLVDDINKTIKNYEEKEK